MENGSFCFELRSHPHLLLVDHLTGVVRNSTKLFLKKTFHWQDASERELFYDLLRMAGWCHDLGKATKDFQLYISETNSGVPRRTRLSQHQALSALLTFWSVKRYLKKRKPDGPYASFLPLLGYLWVKRHHGNLKNLFDEQSADDELMPMDNELIEKQIGRLILPEFSHLLKILEQEFAIELPFTDFKENWRQLADKIYPMGKRLYRQLRNKPDQRLYLIFQWCYSLLLTADKYHAMLGEVPETDGDNNVGISMLEKFRRQRFQSRTDPTSRLRDSVYRDCLAQATALPLDRHFLTLNVPTGSGKTLAGLGAALKLRERIMQAESSNPKIIYCLPFMSIIDQNFNVFAEVFENPPASVLLKHHSLTEMTYQQQSNQEYDVDRAALLIEGWDASIVVTTFVQFFHTIIGNRNMMVRRLHQFSDSIIILDEIQTLPYRFWAVVENLFALMAGGLNCRFILMTATLPRLLPEKKIFPLVPNADYYFSQFDRYRVKINLNPMTLPEMVDHVEEFARSSAVASILIIVNTTRVARELYQKLAALETGYEMFHLSTRLTPNTRLQRIEEIKTYNSNKIVVSTQLVEAGVDLDFDLVIRDFSPLDSLNQAAGRCNREGSKTTSTVEFVVLVDENGKPYYRFIYGKEDLLKLLSTKEVIGDTSELSESQFITSIRNYYSSIKEKQGSDLADDIMKKMGQLAFSKLAQFKLIDDDYPSASIFIPENQKALKIWHEYLEIQNIPPSFEKRKQFLKIKPTLMQYVISVPRSLLPESLNQIGAFYFLPSDNLEFFYQADVGFNPETEQQNASFIF